MTFISRSGSSINTAESYEGQAKKPRYIPSFYGIVMVMESHSETIERRRIGLCEMMTKFIYKPYRQFISKMYVGNINRVLTKNFSIRILAN